MHTTSSAIGYDPVLVALSIAIATFAAFTALELGDRAVLSGGRTRSVWIAAAAVAMGGGIWSMHFVGMLAFRLQVPIAYDFGRTLLS
ncbi:MAG: histidine kinase, partial [Oxalobacteraceae bacterium]